MTGIIYNARSTLIRIGKALPFVICAFVMFSYIETTFAIMTDSFVEWGGYIIPKKPITWMISPFIEYNTQTLVILWVLSIAIRTCAYNKCSCAYLTLNMFEKSFFDFELEPTYIFFICMLNIAISGYLTWKGVKRL